MLYKRKLLSQNFLKDAALVSHLVGKCGFGKNDTIVDIGAGSGIIAKELAKFGGNVIAVEIDKEIIPHLKNKLQDYTNVTIVNADIRQYVLPANPYKIFANVPFHITSDIIYKLLYYSNAPEQAFLVVQKEAAEKFSGLPHETQFSLLAKPWFEFKVVWTFKRSDFDPQPDVDSVLLKIARRPFPLISPDKEPEYKNFIKFAFNTWKKDLKVGLKRVFTYEQWKRLARENNFNIHAKPTDLTFRQWLEIFNFASGKKSKDHFQPIDRKNSARII